MSYLPLSLSAEPQPNMGPQTIFGYEILGRLGDGAGSRVYAVSDPVTKQVFALKHVVREEEKHIRFVEQLETECEVGKKVSHPALRRVITFKCNRTLLRKVTDAVLVMEMFDGTPLEAHVPKKLTDLLDCFIDVASALAAMNAAGFVHCDLKPNNILRSNDGKTKVIDLGQACAVGTIKPRIQGTPDFISPEQVHCKAVTKATDVFNFGATLYWALTGQKVQTLFNLKKGENSFLLDDTIPSPHTLDTRIPETLSNLVMECVRTNPVKRPQDMTTVSQRLEVIRYGIEKNSSSKRMN